MRNVLFWAAFPFLVPQALYVRRTAPRFAPAGGPAEGSVGNGKQIRLLAIGDSIIAGVGATDFSKALVGQTAAALAESKNCRVSWLALGVSGYDSSRVLEYLIPELPGVALEYVILSVGVNEDRPDYEYADGVTFHVFELDEGVVAKVTIPALDGTIETTVKVRRTGSRIKVSVKGASKPWAVLLRGIEAVASVEGGTAQAEALGTRLVLA